MFNDKAARTILSRYGVSNVSKSEEFVHISKPDKYSPIYHEFTEHISTKVGQLAKLLADHNIPFSANEFIDGHLYRLSIPNKDLLFDFEYYPVINYNYNYIRVNYNDDIEVLFKKLYPANILSYDNIEVWQIPQITSNRFLKETGVSPIYDKSAIRLAIMHNGEIYQSAVVKRDKECKEGKLVSNVTRLDYQVEYGTILLLRYFKERYDISSIEIHSNIDNSFQEITYQLLGMKILSEQHKKKIWWSPKGCEWHIKKEHINEYVPFYFTEKRVWIF